jgi:homoserine kinase
MQQVTVRVPASTSNLGPGFDCLGVALRLYNDVILTRGAKSRPPAIACAAADLFFERMRCAPFSFSVLTKGDVPSSRGLGGSVTVRLGVLVALNFLTGNRLDRLSIFQLCAHLERHPDNAAPAAFGGFTVVRQASHLSWQARFRPIDVNCAQLQRFEVSARLHFVLLIPDLEIKTAAARKILPQKISRVAAIDSCQNACAITAAFASRNYRNLRGAFRDHMHQPYRQKLVPFLPRVIAAAERAGALGAFLSGSGSTICAVTLQNRDKVAAAMLRAARTCPERESNGSVPARSLVTTADNVGAQILRQSPNTNH